MQFFFTIWEPRRHLAIERKRSAPFASATLAEEAARRETATGQVWVVTRGPDARVVCAEPVGGAKRRPSARPKRSS